VVALEKPVAARRARDRRNARVRYASMTRAERERRVTLDAEMRGRLGLAPAIFQIAASAEIAEQLWEQAKVAYLDSPLPSVFKEELFAYLSRFCAAPYCMARHAAFLQRRGYPAGDRSAIAREPSAVLSLLRQPIPRYDALEGHLKSLAGYAQPIEAWPETVGSSLGQALWACAIHIFLGEGAQDRCLAELRRALDPEALEWLMALLGYIRNEHLWAEAHPQVAFERDLRALLREQPELRSWVEEYRSAVQAERGDERRPDLLRLESESLTQHQSTQHLGAVLEKSLNEIYVFDAETLHFTLVNRRARRNLGYSMDELRELTPPDLKPEFTLESFQELLLPLRSGEKSHIECTTVHRRKDGSLYPVEVHLQRSSAAGSDAFVAVLLDLTERHAQQDAISASEARAEAILNAAVDAIITINKCGVIESVNPATIRLFGYEESELLGQNVRILAPPAHVDAHDGYINRYLETHEARIVGKSRELEARRKDGSIFPIRVSMGEAALNGERLFTAIIQDLSAQRAAENERDERDRRLRALFHQRTSLAGVCTCEGVLLEANKASLEYVGVEMKDVVGRPFWTTPWWAHDPELQEKLREAIEKAAQGEFVRFDARHPRVDGAMGTVDFSVTPVTGADGSIEALLVESIDITEARSLQEQLLQSQKMEAVGVLAGGIAHDFNNLLMSIRGSSEILLEHLEPVGRLARSARRIQRAADRATALTRRILGLSRKQIVHRRPFELNALVEETQELFVEMLPEDVELVTNRSDEALYVKADESQIGQVLMNLLVNAADAMTCRGSILVATAREAIHGERAELLDVSPGDFVALVVRDTGEGMQSETLAKIFDPFFTTKEAGKGTGLGLATSLGIVREHGGAIEVESEIGIGTTFTVLLPQIPSPAVEVTADAGVATRARASGDTLLLVEDDEIMRDLLTEILEETGYVVVAAAEPAEALRRVQTHDGTIDLVITDVVMPRTSGFELVKELRAHRPDIRILYMSGYTDQVLASRGELHADDAFIRKPFGNDYLLAKVREVLDANPRRSE
jgi:PAS domain S-box-containing protein